MPHPLTLPALSVLAVLGSGMGLFLGRAAISEINPAYYSDPEPRFHADLSPNPPSMDAPVYRAGALSAAEFDQALGTGCVGCRTYPEEYYPVHDTDEHGYRTGWASVDDAPVVRAAVQTTTPSEVDTAERAAEEAAHQADLVRVHRYSSYTVSEAAPAQETTNEPGPQYASAEVALDE